MKPEFPFITALLLCFISISCNKKDNSDLVPAPLFKNSWEGSLEVTFTNLIPPWSESSTLMSVHIDTWGIVSIEDGSLEYNGDTIINNSSRIERGGFWQMSPEGILKTYGGVDHIDVDAHVNIFSDVQNVYAKDNDGNWILVGTFDYSGTPGSDISFIFNDAIATGSTVGINEPTGSIIWILQLSPTLVP